MPTYSQLRQLPRIDLVAQSPLGAPLSIYVEPTNVCNFRCTMCPESLPDYGLKAGYYQHMDMALFQRVMFQVREFGMVDAVKLYDEGEPLLHKSLPEMIVEASQVAERVEVTTNGSLLTSDVSKRLVAAGLDYLRVSIYSVTAAHQAVTGQSRFLPSAILENVRALRGLRNDAKPFICAQLLHSDPTEQAMFREMYTGVADELMVEKLHNWGTLVKIGQQPTARKVCPSPFYTLVVKANGDVTVCCVDWQGTMVLGNVREQTLKRMWNSPLMHAIRLQHLRGNRSRLPACAHCTYLDTLPDDVDGLTEEAYCERS